MLAPLDPDSNPQGDDYFSSDISEKVIANKFSRIKAGIKLLFLMSERDRFVPDYVDKEVLLER